MTTYVSGSSAERVDTSRAAATTAPFDTLRDIVITELARITSPPDDPKTWMSFALLRGAAAVSVEVPVSSIALFLDRVGDATVSKGLVDPQFSLTKRTGKSETEVEAITGIIVDIDRRTSDMFAEIERAGVPTPNVVFQTRNGFKPLYVASKPMSAEVFGLNAKSLTLGFEGGDPASWNAHQMQRLPHCLRTSHDGSVVEVRERAVMLNPVALDVDSRPPFPQRILQKRDASG